MLIVGGYGIFYAYKENDQQKSSTKAVLLNKDFRQSLGFAIGRTNYAAQLNGKESANTAVRNIFVKPDFFQADGKDFGTMVMDQLPAYGDEWSGVNLADSQDGLYNPEKAKAEFAKAKEALQAEGVQFPIYLDIPVIQTSNFLLIKCNLSNSLLKPHLEKRMLSLISINCQPTISTILLTMLRMQQQRFGTCQLVLLGSLITSILPHILIF